MQKPNGLAKNERLSSIMAVRRIFTEGTSGFVYPFRFMTIIEESASPTVEVLFSVPKRFHKRANKRNILRRRTKESYRLSKQRLIDSATDSGKSIDVALVYSSKDVVSYKVIDHAIQRILEEISARC